MIEHVLLKRLQDAWTCMTYRTQCDSSACTTSAARSSRTTCIASWHSMRSCSYISIFSELPSVLPSSPSNCCSLMSPTLSFSFLTGSLWSSHVTSLSDVAAFSCVFERTSYMYINVEKANCLLTTTQCSMFTVNSNSVKRKSLFTATKIPSSLCTVHLIIATLN